MAEEAYRRVTYHTPERPSLRALVRAREERKRELLRRGVCPCCEQSTDVSGVYDNDEGEEASMRRTSEEWLALAMQEPCEVFVAHQLALAERAEKREKQSN